MMKNSGVKELEEQVMVGNNRVTRLEEQVSQLKEQIQSLQQDSNNKQVDLRERFNFLVGKMGKMDLIRKMTFALWQRQEQPKMLIYVKAMYGGKTVTTLKVDSSDTIYILKMKFEVAEGISPDFQSLLYAGKLLKDGKTLADYNIQNESTIDFLIYQRGC